MVPPKKSTAERDPQTAAARYLFIRQLALAAGMTIVGLHRLYASRAKRPVGRSFFYAVCSGVKRSAPVERWINRFFNQVIFS